MNGRFRRMVATGKGRARRRRFELEPLESRRLLAWQYTVSVAADRVDPLDGSFLSLREAIAYSNSGVAGKSAWAYPIGGSVNQIVFQVPTGGSVGAAQTLSLGSALPALTAPVSILAQSQGAASFPNGQANLLYHGPQLITLDGSGIAAGTGSGNGIEIAASNCSVDYLIVSHFQEAGILVTSGQGSVLINNRIGLDVRDVAAPNGAGVVLAGGVGTQVGNLSGPNVIAGNLSDGIRIDGAAGSIISNNSIGASLANAVSLNARAVPNGGDGILLRGADGASPNTTIRDNVIAGNLGNGIELVGPNVSGTAIRSNTIGAGPDGKSALPNAAFGVLLINASGQTITDNTIVANRQGGVQLRGASNSNVLQSNRIGVGSDGVTPLGNLGDGLAILDGSNNLIGGASPVQGNTISGSVQGDGIRIAAQNGTPRANAILNNKIGADSAGMTAIGNGQNGIELVGAADTVIGGGSGQGNVIGGNRLDGLLIRDGSSGTIVQGNLIGIDATAATNPATAGPLSNLRNGVHIVGSSNNTIGMSYVGPPPGQTSPETYSGSGNVIAFNSYPNGGTAGAAGIFVESGTDNSLLRNVIFNNLGKGIDLNLDGNGPGPASANHGQPSPIVLSAQKNPVTGLLDLKAKINTPAGAYHIEFFSNPASDTGAGKSARSFIGSVNVIVDASGTAAFNTSLPISLNSGDLLTATATRLDSSSSMSSAPTDTSELSQSVQVDARADVGVTLTASPSAQVGLGDFVVFTATITNAGPNTATGVVLYDATARVAYPVPDLPANATFTQVIRVQANTLTAISGQYLTRTVTVSANEIDDAPANNAATAPNGTPGIEVIRIGGSLQLDGGADSTPMPASGTRNVSFNVTRTGGVNGTALVDYVVRLADPNDAQYAPAGYPTSLGNPIVASGTLTFADLSSASASIAFPIFAISALAPPGHNVVYTISLSNVRDDVNGPHDVHASLGAPSSRTLTVVNTNPAHGSLALGQAVYTATASSGAVTVVVNRTGGSDGVVSVQLATADGSAIAGLDYQATTQTVTFANGDTTPRLVTIPLINRQAYSTAGVSFQVLLSAPNGQATLGAPSSTLVQVQQDGTPPPQAGPGVLQFATGSVHVNPLDGFAQFTVSRLSGTSGAVAVRYATVAGAAIEGRDFVATTGTLAFADGQTTQTFTIPIPRSARPIGPLDFQVVLSSPTGGAAIGSIARATAWIENVDPALTGPVVTGLTTRAAGGSIVAYVVTFDQPIDRASAAKLANYQIVALGPNGSARKSASVAIASARLDATGTVLTLTPRAAQASSRFYRVMIQGASSGLRSASGHLLDGDSDGLAGGNYVASIGRGGSLSYVDAGGNLVSMSVNKAQSIEITRNAAGQGQTLTLFGLRRRQTVLIGSVRRLAASSTGRTTFLRFVGTGGLGDVRYRMSTPPISVQQTVPGGPLALARG